MGRTVPSISSLLDCHCDILQLDVIWLYDNFDGGGGDIDTTSTTSTTTTTSVGSSSGINKRADGESLSLLDLANIRLASINSSK